MPRRLALLAPALVVAVVVFAIANTTPLATKALAPSCHPASKCPAPTATATPAPTATPPTTAAINHVVVVWLENEEATGITATRMPYLYGLQRPTAGPTEYYAVSHPSLPELPRLLDGTPRA